MPIESPLQQLIVDFLKEKKVSQRKFGEVTGRSESLLNKYNQMSSAMGIDVLDKIVSEFPEIKPILLSYLGGNTDEKHTPATKDGEAAIRKELQRLRNENAALRKLTTAQAQAILHFSNSEMIEHG